MSKLDREFKPADEFNGRVPTSHDVSDVLYTIDDSFAANEHIRVAFNSNKLVSYEDSTAGLVVDFEKFNSIISSFIETNKLRLFASSSLNEENSAKNAFNNSFYVNADKTICLRVTKPGMLHPLGEGGTRHVNVSVLTFDSNVSEFLLDIKKLFVDPESSTNGFAYVLAVQHGNLTTRNIGLAGTPLVNDNYPAQVVHQFSNLIEDFSAGDPAGRLGLIVGPPGTGKTYFIRALMDACDNATFVIIPPGLVSKISDPDFLPTIQSAHRKNGPVIIVLEDADSVLVTRTPENVAALSSVLNLTDGIAGNLLDTRILMTTNAATDQIDPAIMRPGRLSEYIKIDRAFNYNEAKVWWDKNVPNIEFTNKKDKEFTLAKLYDMKKRAERSLKKTETM